jgi:tyrosyl-tRNA synthetase
MMVHGKEAFEQAYKMTQALFSNEFNSLDEPSLKMLSSTLKQTSDLNLVDAIVSLELATSKREARTFITSQAISINGLKVSDTEYVLSKHDALFNRYIILKRGKKLYGVVLV